MLRTVLTAAAFAAIGAGVGWLIYRMEHLVVDFTAFDAAVTAHNEALTGAVTRVQEDVTALQQTIEDLRANLDPEAQAKLDERTAALQASTDVLNSIDPVPSAPAEPSEPTV